LIFGKEQPRRTCPPSSQGARGGRTRVLSRPYQLMPRAIGFADQVRSADVAGRSTGVHQLTRRVVDGIFKLISAGFAGPHVSYAMVGKMLRLFRGKCREILTKCRETGKRNPAKTPRISAAWIGLSLLQEQGGYSALAGTLSSSGAALHPRESIKVRRCPEFVPSGYHHAVTSHKANSVPDCLIIAS
jgi:hypothetical protein